MHILRFNIKYIKFFVCKDKMEAEVGIEPA